MPLYEIEWFDCDVLFEERLSLAPLDEAVVEFTICYTPRVKKVINAPPYSSAEGAPIHPALK